MLSAEEVNRRYFREAYRTGVHGWAVEAPALEALGALRRLKRLVGRGRLLDMGAAAGGRPGVFRCGHRGR